MPTTPRILIVDDEENIRSLLQTALGHEGFDTLAARTGNEALDRVSTYQPDLIILDVMLPDLDGFSVLSRLRAAGGKVPIIFLSARTGTADRVRGLTTGGDDYITKPFSLAELIARIRLRLRDPGGETLSCADLSMDPEAHRVRRNGERIHLSPTEFKLLYFLMENSGRVLSRAQILDHVWPYDFDGDWSVVDTYISYLRRKIETIEPKLIHTVRGVGFSLRDPNQ